MSSRKKWIVEKIEKLYYSYDNEQFDKSLLEKEIIKTFEEIKDKTDKRCYNQIGLSLNKVSPINKKDKTELDIIFWKVADNWNNKITDAYPNWKEKMTDWVIKE